MVVNLLGQFDWVLDHRTNTLLGKSMVVEKKKFERRHSLKNGHTIPS